MSVRFRLIPVTFLVLLSACDSFGLSGPERGTFEVKVEGYVDHSFQGEAVFETLHGLGGESVFLLMLLDVDEPGEKYRIVEFVNVQKPDIGTYRLANLEEPDEGSSGKFAGSYDDSENYGRFKSTGGVLKIRFGSDKVLKGSFDFTAFEMVLKGGGEYKRVEVRITGEFHAEEGDTGIILN